MKTYVSMLTVAATFAVAVPIAAHPDRVTPPPVPAEIRVPAGYKPFLAAHAIGNQGYVCVPSGMTFKWIPFGPQATLFNEDNQQILTHFLSPTPYSQVLGPAWQHSRDTSAVWAQMIKSSSDPNYVTPGAIPWLLLEATVVGDGPTGGDKLTATRYIHRVNTFEGAAPATGCGQTSDVGKRALVYYEADYIFYREKGRNGDID